MAILVSGGINSSQIKGKVGNVVFKQVNRRTVLSAYQPIVKNPKTFAQRLVRSKFLKLTNTSRAVYNEVFKLYGIKLKGHSAYSSVMRMIYNNPVVKSVGYADGYLPEYPKNADRIIGVNTDLTNEIFNYLVVRCIPGTAMPDGTINFVVGFSIPKGLLGYSPSGSGNNPGGKFIGTNIAMESLDCVGVLQGNSRFRLKGEIHSFAINPRFGVDSDVQAIGASIEDIGGAYKYVIKTTLTYNLATDPANTDNYFISMFDEISVPGHLIECAWNGVEKKERIGATLFLFSTSQTSIDLNDDEQNSAFLSRFLLLGVNSYSEKYSLT